MAAIKTRKLKITPMIANNGAIHGHTVEIDGQVLNDVVGITWSVSVESMTPHCTIKLRGVVLDTEGECDVKTEVASPSSR